MKNLVQRLYEWTESQPEHDLLSFLDGRGSVVDSYSYASFDARSNFLADHLQCNTAVSHGEPVLLVYGPGLDFAVAFFACVKVGALPVPVPPPGFSGSRAELARLGHIARDCGARVVLSDTSTHAHTQSVLEKRHGWMDDELAAAVSGLSWSTTDTIEGSLAGFPLAAGEDLFLQYTSGSTSEPKGVLVTHENVIHNCGILVDHDAPVGVSWLPHFHDMGLIGFYLFAPVTGGASYCFSPVDFLRRPALWFEAMTTHRATITSAPNFAYDFCLREDRIAECALADFDLSTMCKMLNGAEPVRATTITGFGDRFARCGLRKGALVAGYGLAEHTLGASLGGTRLLTVDPDRLDQNSVTQPNSQGRTSRIVDLISTGAVPEGVSLRIVDPATQAVCVDGEAGEIWLDGPSKAKGYWGKPKLSAALFEARLEGEPADVSYLRTGDIGFLQGGELFVCGRLKDMLVIRGQNIFPSDIEAALAGAQLSIDAGDVVAFAADPGLASDRLVVLIEQRRNKPSPDLKEVAAYISREFQVVPDMVGVVRSGAISRTSSGKIARRVCATKWVSGDLDTLACHAGNQPALEIAGEKASLDAVLHRAVDAGHEGRTLDGLGLDSIELVNLSLQIEELFEAGRFSGAFSTSELHDLRVLQSITVGDLLELVDETRSERPDRGKIIRLRSETLKSVRLDEAAAMKADALLADTVRPGAVQEGGAEGALFITGATGFLGLHLLNALLEQTDRPIIALVRAGGDAAAHDRLVAAFKSAGLWRALTPAAFESRVSAVRGDLSRPRLGMTDDLWSRVAHEATEIFHCGAEVDYVKTYRALRAANVLGTAEILNLACIGARKIVHHVSTTFIFGWSIFGSLKEDATNARMKDLDFGYAQTKWVAEQLVFEARRRGIDARIYRPSLVTASRDGHFTRHDITARVLGYMIRHKVSVRTPNQVSFIPVDVLARNLIAISQAVAEPSQTYHLTADSHYDMVNVTEAVSRQFGIVFQPLDISGFVAHANAFCTEQDDLFPLLPFLNKNSGRIHRMRNKRYDNTNYVRARSSSLLGMADPPLADTVRWIVEYLQREGVAAPFDDADVADEPSPCAAVGR
jgi:thioester reductase-like protein